MNNVIIDFTACIVTGGSGLRERLAEAEASYAPESRTGYFSELESKTGRAFAESACGFLLLDSLLQKHRFNRRELVLSRREGERPCFAGRTDLDFSISHSDGCAFCCLEIGEGARIGGDIEHDKRYDESHLSELAMIFMDEEEQAAFYYADDKRKEFYTAWTRREAYIKRTGGNVFDNLLSEKARETGALIRGEQFIDGVICACGERYYYSINSKNIPYEKNSRDDEKEEAR